MKFLMAALAALALAAPASAEFEIARAPDYSGKFSIVYIPVYCVRAPCPPGNYAVRAIGGETLASVKTVKVDTSGDEALEQAFTRTHYFQGVAVEGDLWVDPGNSRIMVRPVRAIPGAWKTETPGPDGDATSPHPVSLIVVNKTRDVIRGIHVAPAGADHWGPDRLENENLSINRRIAIALPTNDCVYDVRIVLGHRPAEEIRRQNVCEQATLVADRSGRIIDRVR